MQTLTIVTLLSLLVLQTAGEDQCIRPTEVAFLLDDSASIWDKHFTEQLNFVKDLVAKFNIGQQTTRIAVAKFSSGVKEEFPFGRYNTVSEVQEAVGNITQRNGKTTDTFAGIQYARENLFKDARNGVARNLIIITDGVSHNRAKTKKQAEETIDSGIIIIVIGVGRIDKIQLAEMASKPTEKFLFTVSTFPELSSIESLVATQACQVPKDEPVPEEVPTDEPVPEEVPKDEPVPEEECHSKPAEVVFVLDRSSSIYINDFQKQLTFVNDVIDIFDIGPNKTRVAAVSFSTDASVEYHLDEYYDKQDIKDRTAKIIYTGGITETRLALALVRDEVLTAEHGVRADVPHIVIVVTDGQSQEYQETKAVAESLKNNGVHMFAIGVGNDTDPQELRDIGSSPSDIYVFEVDSYGALDTIKNIVAYRTCRQEKHKPCQ